VWRNVRIAMFLCEWERVRVCFYWAYALSIDAAKMCLPWCGLCSELSGCALIVTLENREHYLHFQVWGGRKQATRRDEAESNRINRKRATAHTGSLWTSLQAYTWTRSSSVAHSACCLPGLLTDSEHGAVHSSEMPVNFYWKFTKYRKAIHCLHQDSNVIRGGKNSTSTNVETKVRTALYSTFY
jgi:hypothetical protein